MINLSDFTDFFIFLGGLTIIVGIVYLFFRRYFHNILISDEEILELKTLNHKPLSKLKQLIINPPASLKRLTIVLLIIIVIGFIFNQFLTWRIGLL